MRRAVLANLYDEKGLEDGAGQTAVEALGVVADFAEGMGAGRDSYGHSPVTEVAELVAFFHRVSGEGIPEEALAAFYAYESQVPRVAAEKARGLHETYGADEKTSWLFHSACHS